MSDTATDPLRALALALPGQVLPGSEGRRYPLGEIVGEGGQGWVFRATWNGSVDVVVKVLRPDATTPESLARFQREAQVLRTLSQQSSPNPHIVRFFDHAYASVYVEATGDHWDLPFTVLEMVEGVTLERALADAQPSGLGLDRARRILRHVVFALRDVHAHDVIHRDLKPSNILLASPGEREIAKVTDFGLAKLLNPGLARTTALAGATVGYAPPEQFEKGNLRVGRHTDVFSLAAIFYELISGRAAFPLHEQAHPLFVMVRILNDARPAFARVRDRLPRELAERNDVIAAIDAALSRALSPRPEERHPTVAEFHAEIEQALDALRANPSLRANAAAGVVVHRSAPPGDLDRQMLSAAKTMPAEAAARAAAPASERPRPAAASSESLAPKWRLVGAPLASDMMLRITVSPSAETAVSAGPHGIAFWEGRSWARLDAPPSFDVRASRATAWLGRHAFFAGASPTVIGVAADRSVATWRFDAPGIVFHGASADPSGVVLAGERPTADGVVGVVAELPLGRRAGHPVRLLDVPGCGPLRAAVRVANGFLACGDMGALVLARERAPLSMVRACDATLHDLLPFADGTAIVVGAGAFAFRVLPGLELELEAMQTKRDLFTIARGPDGAAWCGGAQQRVLRRAASGWMREGSLAGPARVRALHVAPSRVLAFMDDGAVLEGLLASAP